MLNPPTLEQCYLLEAATLLNLHIVKLFYKGVRGAQVLCCSFSECLGVFE